MKLCATVVLYEPLESDIKNIHSYLNDIDKLYVVDNSEKSNNKNRLPESDKIIYIYNNANYGVAKALNIGADAAIKDGFSWLITMDQDTSFERGVINKIKDYIIKNNTKDIGIITPWHNTKLDIKKSKEKYEYPLDVMTSGNFLNLEIWKKICGFKESLFIDGVDIEYCLNLKRNNYKVLRINNLELKHNLGNIKYKKLLGKKILVTNHNYLRRYYMMRNYRYIYDTYHNDEKEFCEKLIKFKSILLSIILYEDNKFKKIKYMIKGYKDYRKGITGKYKG